MLWDTLGKLSHERRFLFKIDGALLSFACLGLLINVGYFLKNLDSTNIYNAFFSGMKEDLGLYENQLNYMGTAWTIGYILGEIPSNILLLKIRPSIWLPVLELIWTTLTVLLATSKNASQIYVLRFFIGLAESGFYPATHYLIGSWYRSNELAKRTTIFYLSGPIASMFSGYLMASVYNLDGKCGLPGWKWLFVMDGVISYPIAFLGFYLVPDTPNNSRARYLTVDERELAKRRIEHEGRKLRQPWTRVKVRKILTSWHLYGLVFQQVVFLNASSIGPIFSQYLKNSTHPKYTIQQINTYPTGGTAIQICFALLLAWTSDSTLRGKRWPAIVFVGALMPVIFVSLAIWDIPEGWRWVCFYLSSVGSAMSGLTFSWAHEICSDDNEERAVVIASMNEIAYVVQAWLPLLVWQQVEGPRYKKGCITSSVLFFLLIPTALYLRRLQIEEHKRVTEHVA